MTPIAIQADLAQFDYERVALIGALDIKRSSERVRARPTYTALEILAGSVNRFRNDDVAGLYALTDRIGMRERPVILVWNPLVGFGEQGRSRKN
jgi:hypothetical protein